MADGDPIECSVITPEEKVLETSATSVVIPAHDGQIGVLKGRAALLCELGIGVLKVDSNEYYIDGGFAQVLDNRVTVLTEHAASADTLSRTDAEKALADAEQMTGTDERSLEDRQKAIARAKTRLKLARK